MNKTLKLWSYSFAFVVSCQIAFGIAYCGAGWEPLFPPWAFVTVWFGPVACSIHKEK